MNTVFKFPAFKLPAELREGFSDDDLVTVTIASEADEVSYDLWLKDFKASLSEAQTDIQQGRGIPSDELFSGLRSIVQAKAAL